MTEGEPLSTTQLLAAASDFLGAGGYRRIEEDRRGKWPAESVRLFEDAYGIVAIVVYETWRELLSGWPNAQEALVELMSRHMSASDAKAWDGYLVLMTSAVMSSETRGRSTDIRYDTSRVRKLLAAGDELKSVADVGRVVLPLLPLELEMDLLKQEAPLDVLPDLLSKKGIPEASVRALVEAFSQQQSLIDRLHSFRTSET